MGGQGHLLASQRLLCKRCCNDEHALVFMPDRLLTCNFQLDQLALKIFIST